LACAAELLAGGTELSDGAPAETLPAAGCCAIAKQGSVRATHEHNNQFRIFYLLKGFAANPTASRLALKA
jgi:oxalate decarboxylase/phosphoglucose isomerase-like protein (cupin superfamily)